MSRVATAPSWKLDLSVPESISNAFAQIREEAGDPDVLVYNAGYIDGRDLPPEMELLENTPLEVFETAQHISSSGPFLVAKEVLPAMRERGEGTILISNNPSSLRGRKRLHRSVSVLSPGHDAHFGAGF